MEAVEFAMLEWMDWFNTIIAGCWSLSASSRRLKPSYYAMITPWQRDSNKIASRQSRGGGRRRRD
jgi:hypothetical protein